MIRKDLPVCPFCGAYARSWEWRGGARVECSEWSSKNGNEHYVGIGGENLHIAEIRWRERYEEWCKSMAENFECKTCRYSVPDWTNENNPTLYCSNKDSMEYGNNIEDAYGCNEHMERSNDE